MLVRRAATIAPAALIVLVAAVGAAAAQSSLGIGVAEQAPASDSGLLGGFFAWIATRQREFYDAMRAALTAMRDGGPGAWLLVGLSFLYGILHAAGPGHGKVVISSYMLANETALRRGIALSFAASLVQALSAIVIVGLGFLVLRQLAVSQTDTTRFFEIASYGLVVALGLWLLVRKLRALRPAAPKPAALSSAAVHDHGHHHHHNDDRHAHDHHHHDHAPGEVCSTCGHAHMPMPDQLSGPMKLRDAAAVVLSVGLRPCTGALIVLTFAFLNGLWAAGLVSVLAMALGTAITVSALATLAVTAKNVALRMSGSSALSGPVSHAIEIGGALLIIAMGVILLGGALGA
ncbi:nickel/cobalt transporter [Oceaniradius stylonematis]|uniref:nickel/cobalt transporter n=1 Tax=Oceaniradius stylonematis TaxID=2184161 RepID=UPI00273E3698|nr:nickel/cobalt transporter [Oceaniradius stylonematis]